MQRPLAAARLSRREVLARLCLATASAAGRPSSALAAGVQTPCEAPAAGELVRVLPLYGPGAQNSPVGRLLGGRGLDARLFTDLSNLRADRLITPIDEMFVRTAAAEGWSYDAAGWTVRLGTGPSGRSVTAAALDRRSQVMGVHLIECAGNSNPQHFGLMSATEWQGVPLVDVLADVPRPDGAWGVLVSGRDDTSAPSRSVPGASWIVPEAELAHLRPFLATRLNGTLLTPHHGAPLRLVVPGWYGCAWIKWVDEIRWVGRDEPTTSQMTEYAVRTHQNGQPALARDYEAPVIDTAAFPIRVEQRRVAGATVYDIVGIVWGGRQPVTRLRLRTGTRDAGTDVVICPAPANTRTWALWTHRWIPASPGYYDLSLTVPDQTVRTRRLDLSYYIRRVRIDEV